MEDRVEEERREVEERREDEEVLGERSQSLTLRSSEAVARMLR